MLFANIIYADVIVYVSYTSSIYLGMLKDRSRFSVRVDSIAYVGTHVRTTIKSYCLLPYSCSMCIFHLTKNW